MAQAVVLVIALVGLSIAWATDALPRHDLMLLAASVLLVYGAQMVITWAGWMNVVGGVITIGLGVLLFTMRDGRGSLPLKEILSWLTVAGVVVMTVQGMRKHRDAGKKNQGSEP